MLFQVVELPVDLLVVIGVVVMVVVGVVGEVIGFVVVEGMAFVVDSPVVVAFVSLGVAVVIVVVSSPII